MLELRASIGGGEQPVDNKSHNAPSRSDSTTHHIQRGAHWPLAVGAIAHAVRRGIPQRVAHRSTASRTASSARRPISSARASDVFAGRRPSTSNVSDRRIHRPGTHSSSSAAAARQTR